MKKFMFAAMAALVLVSCGGAETKDTKAKATTETTTQNNENTPQTDYKAIFDDATKSINEVKSQAEIDLIEQELENDLFALYEANTEECDKDNMKLPEEEKTALTQYAAAKAAYDKAVEAKKKEFDITNEKNVDAKAYNDFKTNCLK